MKKRKKLCVFISECTCSLCSTEARVCVMSGNEITVDWLSHTERSVPLWTHTCGLLVLPSKHIIKDTQELFSPADWLSSCLFLYLFFCFIFNHRNSPSYVCVYVIFISVCMLLKYGRLPNDFELSPPSRDLLKTEMQRSLCF